MKFLRNIRTIVERAVSYVMRWEGPGADRPSISQFGDDEIKKQSLGTRTADSEISIPGVSDEALVGDTERPTPPTCRETLLEIDTSEEISHDNRFQCVICEMSLLTPEALGAHYTAGHKSTELIADSIFRVNGVGGIECPDCPLEFESSREQIAHRITSHKVEST